MCVCCLLDDQEHWRETEDEIQGEKYELLHQRVQQKAVAEYEYNERMKREGIDERQTRDMLEGVGRDMRSESTAYYLLTRSVEGRVAKYIMSEASGRKCVLSKEKMDAMRERKDIAKIWRTTGYNISEATLKEDGDQRPHRWSSEVSKEISILSLFSTR